MAPRKGGVTVLRAGYNMERYTPPFVAPQMCIRDSGQRAQVEHVAEVVHSLRPVDFRTLAGEGVGLLPVSYTHLDVYKRQMLPTWSRTR